MDRSLVSSIVQPTGVGNASEINITTRSLSLTNLAQLFSKIGGQGNAGSININARDTVFLSDISSILNTVESTGTGNSGEINITTGSLCFKGSSMGSASEGQGNASTLNIHARDTISLDGTVIATLVLITQVASYLSY